MPSVFKKGTNNFFKGISDFWTRFFAEKSILTQLGVGNQVLVSQTYLDLLEAILRLRLDVMPLFDKKKWRLISFRKSNIVDTTGTDDEGRQAFYIPSEVKKFNFIQDTFFYPQVIFERDFEFTIRDQGEKNPKLLVFRKPIDIFSYSSVIKRETPDGDEEVILWIPDADIDENPGSVDSDVQNGDSDSQTEVDVTEFNINGERMLSDVILLSDESLAGRMVGHKGNVVAAERIANAMAEIGLEPIGGSNSYYQYFE